MIAPLQCISCNAPLAVPDAPSVACPFCGTINRTPQSHREALRLTRDLDEATRAAIREWARLNQIVLPRWLFVSAALAPFVLLAGGLALILLVGLLWPESRNTLPLLVGVALWLPLIPAQALAATAGMKNILVSGAARVGVTFAALPPLVQGAPPNCRQCGAALSVRPDDLLVRCLYCQADNIVSLDWSTMHALESRLVSARASLAQAMAALSAHARLARLETRGRTLIIAGLLILPLVWSFARSLQSSYWSLLIAVDVWVLGICIFWNVREAFLPPVTVEDLGALLENSQELPAESDGIKEPAVRVAGTRGWYDHASEKQNFAIPATLALIFLAIELLVLEG